METSTHYRFRLAILLLATLLGGQSMWLVLAELSYAGIDRVPTNLAAAVTATGLRNRATLAAEIGFIRGELWAQSAFTYADLLFGENEPGADSAQKLTRVRVNLEHALTDAPSQPGAWLLRAGFGLRYPSLGFDTVESLKMSYYTGPSEEDLIPLRLRLTVQSNTTGDVDMGRLIRRDLLSLVARKQQSPIAEAYNAASPAGRRFIERTLGDIDPSAAESLRSGAKKQTVPD